MKRKSVTDQSLTLDMINLMKPQPETFPSLFITANPKPTPKWVLKYWSDKGLFLEDDNEE